MACWRVSCESRQGHATSSAGTCHEDRQPECKESRKISGEKFVRNATETAGGACLKDRQSCRVFELIYQADRGASFGGQAAAVGATKLDLFLSDGFVIETPLFGQFRMIQDFPNLLRGNDDRNPHVDGLRLRYFLERLRQIPMSVN